HTFGLQPVVVFDVAWNMLGRACRCKSTWKPEDHDLLAAGQILDLHGIGPHGAAVLRDFVEFLQRSGGQPVTDFDGHALLLVGLKKEGAHPNGGRPKTPSIAAATTNFNPNACPVSRHDVALAPCRRCEGLRAPVVVWRAPMARTKMTPRRLAPQPVRVLLATRKGLW